MRTGVGNYPLSFRMMKTLWIDPNAIADVWTINNRKENPGHIESLAESMRQNGYLPEYPIIAFQAANIPIETDKPYLVACGHHRRKAALAAEIDLIFAEVHDGTEEDWIEMMSLDNFQFDVASTPGIGLAFTEQERRAACFQLLLLPKYLRKTNVSLAGLWKVGEGTVRRWRKQVESLIGEGSPKLEKEWNVSPGRIESLRSVIADPYRENEDGATVAVRQKPKETTPEERAEFWFTIRKSGLFDQRSDGSRFLDRHGFQMEAFNAYICERFNIKADGIPHQLSMTQLKKIYNWILTDDPEVIAQCQEIQRERDALSVARSGCYDWYDQVVRAFDETLSPTPGNTHTPVHISAFKAFQKLVKKQIGFDVEVRHEANTPAQLTEVQEMFEHLYSDIQNEADWILTFKAEFSDKIRQDRKALEQTWANARREMFTALAEYPRDVTEVAFSNRFDERFGHPSGRTRTFTEPTPAITDETLTADIRHFKAATTDIHADTEWMQAMPVPIPLIAALTEARITELVIKVEGGSQNTRIAEFNAETVAKWIPTELQEQLIKLANRFIYKD